MVRRDGEGYELCPCGLPLHYHDPHIEQRVRAEIERSGPTVDVPTSRGVYAVPRHYIALHGRYQIAEVARAYGFSRVDGASH